MFDEKFEKSEKSMMYDVYLYIYVCGLGDWMKVVRSQSAVVVVFSSSLLPRTHRHFQIFGGFEIVYVIDRLRELSIRWPLCMSR
jgi:hypothetical protein